MASDDRSPNVPWRELETKGVVLVPGFLSDEEVAGLHEDFLAGPPPSSYQLGYKPLGAAGIDGVRPKIEAVLGQVRAHTALEVDVVLNGYYFATRHIQKTDAWHQDYDAYYQHCHDHINYLNFYMPIVKPDRDSSNLSVVPFDGLRARAPALHDRLRGGGANFLIQRKGQVVIDNPGEASRLRVPVEVGIDELAVTPKLVRGDLLLLRGDVLHRSQDLAPERVAASVRTGASKHRFEPNVDLSWYKGEGHD